MWPWHRNSNKGNSKMISTIEINRALKMPNVIARVLKEYEYVMPLKLPKKLPLRKAIDHKIELVLGATPSSQPSYHMSLSKLDELWRQLDELINDRFIQLFKALYGALVMFQKKANDSLWMCVDIRAQKKLTIKNKHPVSLV